MSNRVRNLDLRLSLPAELRPQSRQLAERLRDGLISTVVDRIAERFHVQFGADAIIEIPRLELSWDGSEAVINDVEHARKLGDELADQLLTEFDTKTIDEPIVGRSTLQSLRVYRDGPHRAAMRIAALAGEQLRKATTANLVSVEQEWRSLCEQGADAIVAAAMHIGEVGAQQAVVENLSRPLLELAVAVSPLSRWPVPMRELVAQRLLEAPERQRAAEDQLPTEPAPTQMRLESEVTDQPNEDYPSILQPDRLPSRVPNVERGEHEATRLPVSHDDAKQVQGKTPSKVGDEARDEVQRTASQADKSATNPALSFDGVVDDPGSDPRPSASADLSTAHSKDVSALDGLPTRYGGLVYLLNLMLRIELPEILWCCGIDEGSFIFDVFKLSAAEEEPDILINWLSGVLPDRSNYEAVEIPGWALAEVVGKTHARLAERASGPRYTFGDDAIASLAVSGATGAWLAGVTSVNTLLRSAFLDLVAAPQEGSLIDYLQQTGSLFQTAGSIWISLPMESIDLDVRRAALDVNPGYLTWTKKTCTLIFDGADSDGH